jgi:hypothetical protein
MCAEYIVAMQAYEDKGGYLDGEVCPYWQAVQRCEARRTRIHAQAIAGIRAKAEVARFMSQIGEEGRRDYDISYTGNWPGEVIEDFLRLTA